MVAQPFPDGDRIEIQGEKTRGDLTEIGLGTMHIRTRDNRLVAVAVNEMPADWGLLQIRPFSKIA